MPRITLHIQRGPNNWTKIPNHLLDELMPRLKDTELRVLLLLLRQSHRWSSENRVVILSYRTLMKRTGRKSEAVANAMRTLKAQGLIHTPKAKLPKRLR